MFITMIEKELAAQSPEVEAYVVNLLGTLANDVVVYAEKKMNIGSNQSAPPVAGAQ